MGNTVHALICWDHRYSQNSVEQHNEVLAEKGRVWWAKFYAEEKSGANLSPLESREGPDAGNAEFAALLSQQVKAGLETRLYICNPDPELFSLHVGRIIDVKFYQDSGVPEEYDRGWMNSCPSYYFQSTDRTAQGLRFKCRYWFLVEGHTLYRDLVLLTKRDFKSLFDISSRTVRPLTFSRPNYYPMPVTSLLPDGDFSKLSREPIDNGPRLFGSDIDFQFIHNSDYKKLAQDLWKDIKRSWVDSEFDSVLVNTGRILECILRSTLLDNAEESQRLFREYNGIPDFKKIESIDKWTLSLLITIAASPSIGALPASCSTKANEIKRKRDPASHADRSGSIGKQEACDVASNLISIIDSICD